MVLRKFAPNLVKAAMETEESTKPAQKIKRKQVQAAQANQRRTLQPTWFTAVLALLKGKPCILSLIDSRLS